MPPLADASGSGPPGDANTVAGAACAGGVARLLWLRHVLHRLDGLRLALRPRGGACSLRAPLLELPGLAEQRGPAPLPRVLLECLDANAHDRTHVFGRGGLQEWDAGSQM
eukprot:CAMPEP_0168423774 /NCGR_PEP_ID=MMETSP0228-20121227/34481_1 /TAXON_ID=133427 /ORGANISM="Protoceratium reticulatum, Strain CCCM 535 (=CCMP 1889)" /LENGTH=109 /DNA_ID=CAMNT_0008437745 /DNA_START=79 /DNA_END=405 /DNA_ORIENTATION=+